MKYDMIYKLNVCNTIKRNLGVTSYMIKFKVPNALWKSLLYKKIIVSIYSYYYSMA